MGSQPCLKKGMLMMTMIQNKNDSTVQCHVCVHRPMCCVVLKNLTTSPPPQPIHFGNGLLSQISKSIHIPPAPRYVMTCLHMEAKLVKKTQSIDIDIEWGLSDVTRKLNGDQCIRSKACTCK